MKFAIPSYNRCEFFGTTTYKYLIDNEIPIEDIYIFVSTHKDFDEYTKKYGDNVILVPTEYEGIGAVRDFILNEWAEDGLDLVMMDDDIHHIFTGSNKSKEKIRVDDLKDFSIDFFKRLVDADLYFGGMCLYSNVFYFREPYSTNLKYISGAIQFYRVDKTKERIGTSYKHFEDYYSDLAHYRRDKGILRCNNRAPATKNYNIEGGICDSMGGIENRMKEAEVNADLIIAEFPRWVSKFMRKKTNRNPDCWNLRLNHKAKFCYKRNCVRLKRKCPCNALSPILEEETNEDTTPKVEIEK